MVTEFSTIWVKPKTIGSILRDCAIPTFLVAGGFGALRQTLGLVPATGDTVPSAAGGQRIVCGWRSPTLDRKIMAALVIILLRSCDFLSRPLPIDRAAS